MIQIETCLIPVLRLLILTLSCSKPCCTLPCDLNKPLHTQSLSFLIRKTDFWSNVAVFTCPESISPWNFNSIFIFSWVITFFLFLFSTCGSDAADLPLYSTGEHGPKSGQTSSSGLLAPAMLSGWTHDPSQASGIPFLSGSLGGQTSPSYWCEPTLLPCPLYHFLERAYLRIKPKRRKKSISLCTLQFLKFFTHIITTRCDKDSLFLKPV